MCAHSCMLAGSARCTSSATSSTGRPAAAHSTRRSTASKMRSRSSSGEATGCGGAPRPSPAARSGASRPSSAGQSACSGGDGTARASCGTSSCQMASGASPPTSTPAPTAIRAPTLSARRASSMTRRVLPMPASPVTSTTRPCPARAAAQAAVSVRSSAARPYSGRAVAGPAGTGAPPGPRASASAARSAGPGRTPSSFRNRSLASRPATRAPARSPAAASCRTRSAWAASFSGSSSQRSRDQHAAAAGSASRSAAADRDASASASSARCCRRAVSAQSSLDAVDALGALADQAGITLIQMAIAFAVRYPAVTSAIIGPRTMEHIGSYLAADGITLSSDVLDRIDEIVPRQPPSTSPTTTGSSAPGLDATSRRR
jgi:Aldo/keto reductase family